jgi:hypothetical protein
MSRRKKKRPPHSVMCDTCEPHDQTETREPKLVSRSLLGTITCHQLSCGHAWHRTAATGSDAPGLTECDCAGYQSPKRRVNRK